MTGALDRLEQQNKQSNKETIHFTFNIMKPLFIASRLIFYIPNKTTTNSDVNLGSEEFAIAFNLEIQTFKILIV